METVSVHEAKTHLSQLLARVEAGEDIMIARNGVVVARLVHEPQTFNREPGSCEGLIQVPDDFDETSQEIIDLFESG